MFEWRDRKESVVTYRRVEESRMLLNGGDKRTEFTKIVPILSMLNRNAEFMMHKYKLNGSVDI